MPNTYTQIYIHFVFVVRSRESLISPEHKEELQRYMTGILTKKYQKLIAISCMPDHTHLFVATQPDIALSDLARDIKNSSSRFINQQKWMDGKFSWQRGFAAFSYGHSQLGRVTRYIENQEAHHDQKTLKDEYLELLEKFDVPYDNKYLW